MIFISIASYKDSDLLATIASLNDNADNPDQLRIVVLNQLVVDEYRQYTPYTNVEMFYIDPSKSRGVCWARSIIQSMVRDEKYYMQIDAHMKFAKGWDTKMIQYLQMANSQKPVLTYYPPGFERDWAGDYVVKNIIRGVGSGAVSSINQILNKPERLLPIPSITSAAGYLFAPIKFVHDIPIDPKIFWNYEETDITLRGYTHGWDFFASPEPLIWHKYNTTGKMVHMEESKVWVELENESNLHAPKKYFSPNYDYPERYKLGSERTLESFEILNNVSLLNKTHDQPAGKKMLVVVPYRDREEHLEVYLQRVPKYLKDIPCDILICELDAGCEWNAGIVCNSLINFIQKDNYEFIYIHHVDVYPYQGWEWPEEGEFITDMGDVGSCLVRTSDFLKVGGYGNNFWGWGAEDDNLYHKLSAIGLKRRKSTVLYDTVFQSHDRPFNGVNYTNNLREIYKPIDNDTIFKSNKIAKTYGLYRISDNVYKQHVKVTHKQPKHRKAVIGYIKNVTEFKFIAPWVKSAVYHGNDYDVWMIVEDDTHESELKAFGVHVFNYTPKHSYLFVDRFNAFKEFLQQHAYDEVIHVDVTDSYFQANPFDLVSGGLGIVSENILIKDCPWNTSMILGNYGYSFPDNEVLCGGVVYGESNLFILLCDKIVEEFNKLQNPTFSSGSDQAILNKLIHSGEIYVNIIDKPLAIHLHHHLKSGVNNAVINGTVVTSNNNERFAIVHQYNRDITLYNNVLDYFSKFFSN